VERHPSPSPKVSEKVSAWTPSFLSSAFDFLSLCPTPVFYCEIYPNATLTYINNYNRNGRCCFPRSLPSPHGVNATFLQLRLHTTEVKRPSHYPSSSWFSIVMLRLAPPDQLFSSKRVWYLSARSPRLWRIVETDCYTELSGEGNG